MCLSLLAPDTKYPFPMYWIPDEFIVPVASFASFPLLDDVLSLVSAYVKAPSENVLLSIAIPILYFKTVFVVIAFGFVLLNPVNVNCLVTESPGLILFRIMLLELFSYVIDNWPLSTFIVLELSRLLIFAAKYEYVTP